MRASDLYTSGAHIRDAFDDLHTAWLETAELWNDGVSRNFCETHLEPGGPVVKLSLDAMSRMSQMVDQMYRECED